MNNCIINFELRFSKRDLFNCDTVAFRLWVMTCQSRLKEFMVLEDLILDDDYVCRLIGTPGDVRYCLEQLGLHKEKEVALLESISNTI